jgi:hypothetical protein
MSRFKGKYPAYVREAVTKAVADGLAPRPIMDGLADGSLDGLGGRSWPLAERTTRRYIAAAREQIRAGGYREESEQDPRVAAMLRDAEACRAEESALDAMERVGVSAVTATAWVEPEARERLATLEDRALREMFPDDSFPHVALSELPPAEQRERRQEIARAIRRYEAEESADPTINIMEAR